MASIAKTCKIENCEGKGALDKTGKRYFVKGFCVKHYKRRSRGQDLNKGSIYDERSPIPFGEFIKIPIGVNAKDGYAIVDKEFGYLSEKKWCLSTHKYPITSEARNKKRPMHYFVMGTRPDGLVTDHINRDKLDNRKANLRFITQRQNIINSAPSKNKLNKYKGVYFIRENCWEVKLSSHGKTVVVGYFRSPEQAALAYNIKAKELFGEYAYLNVV